MNRYENKVNAKSDPSLFDKMMHSNFLSCVGEWASWSGFEDMNHDTVVSAKI